jgi:hypothetical protein
MITVLSPLGVGRRFAETVSPPNRFGNLASKRLGLLDNGKPKADLLESRIEELFRERFGVAQVIRRRKVSAQQPAPAEDLIELANSADLVINGLGD